MLPYGKKVINCVLMGTMLLSVLAGCGSTAGNTTGSSIAASETKTAGAQQEDSSVAKTASKDTSGEDVTLTVWDWDSAFSEHMTEYYTKSHPNVHFNFVNVSSADYFQKLQGALSSGEGVPDVILCEMGYRGKVFDLGILDDLTKAPYNLNPSEMYDFAVSLDSDKNGTLLGVEQQVCPSGLAYRRDLAKQYFGTDDPASLEAMFPDWDSFIRSGKEVADKSGGKEYMLPGVASGAFYILRNQDCANYITDTSIDITGRYGKDISTLSNMVNAGIIMPGDTETTIADGFAKGSFIFYPCAPWVEKWYISANDPDGSGNWGLMAAPGGGFTYGGTSVGVYKDSKNKEAAWDYIRYTYGDGDGIKESYNQFGFMSGFKAAYGDDSVYLQKSQYDDFFGGQELGKKYKEIMENGLKGQVQTTNESNVVNAISVVGAAYDNDPSMTSDELLKALIAEVQSECPSVEVK
ncbi:MAG: extracellular solute-binding protein [Butyrivibrio sp.]|jgi:multiple sugar transport system substrate-binding protein|nr:extracellular solute-binding protein [Butyrivibrio sp.]